MEEAGRFLRPMMNDEIYFQFIGGVVGQYSARLSTKGIIVAATGSG